MKKLITLFLISVIGIIPGFSMSNSDSVPPGNWAKVESLAQKTEISVKMLFGDKMQGKFLGLDPDAIRVNIYGEERVFPRKDIAEIHLMNINDSNQNGVGIGVLVGAIPLALLIGFGMRGEGDAASAAAMGALMGGGIGGLVGYVADNLHKGSELIYRALNSN
jgi:hypothetical protein